jgi:hypothetical protein
MALSTKKEKKNKNQIIYDYGTKQYSIDGNTYSSFKEARSKRWQCDRCENSFGNIKQLRLHKADAHSY